MLVLAIQRRSSIITRPNRLTKRGRGRRSRGAKPCRCRGRAKCRRCASAEAAGSWCAERVRCRRSRCTKRRRTGGAKATKCRRRLRRAESRRRGCTEAPRCGVQRGSKRGGSAQARAKCGRGLCRSSESARSLHGMARQSEKLQEAGADVNCDVCKSSRERLTCVVAPNGFAGAAVAPNPPKPAGLAAACTGQGRDSLESEHCALVAKPPMSSGLRGPGECHLSNGHRP